jgi:hypothetical protein
MDSIQISKLFKKVDGKWKQLSKEEFSGEDDLDGLVLKTKSKRMFKIIEKKNEST